MPEWESWVGEAFDGSPLEGELGRLTVPENREAPSDRRIELAFVRYRTTNPRPAPTIFFLAGGPGGSGVELAGKVATHPQLRLLEIADVVGIDQRGTGRSRPNLMEPVFTSELPLDRAIDRADLVGALREAAGKCVAYWEDRSVDLGAYQTRESARDVEEVRAALGLSRINVFGSSYGSHLGVEVLRRDPTHVARAVLIGLEGPDQTWKLPSTTQRHLEMLSRACARDPEVSSRLPNLEATIAGLLEELEREPVMVALPEAPATDHTGRVRLAPLDVQIVIAHALDSVAAMEALPARIARWSRGDWQDLAAEAREHRRVEVRALPLLMDCASGASALRRERITTDLATPHNLLGDGLDAPFYLEGCEVCARARLDDAFREDPVVAVPTLLVSGTLDVRTPPSNVIELAAGFAHSVHIVVEGAAHDSRELMSPEYRYLLQEFLRGSPVAGCTLSLPGPRFAPIAPIP
ncbi:MAG: alpha/beta fold hydrolase [Candidatus Eisenbacteria bacterium]